MKKHLDKIVAGLGAVAFAAVTLWATLPVFAQDNATQPVIPAKTTDGSPNGSFAKKGEVFRDLSANRWWVKTGADGTNGYSTLSIDALGNAVVGTVTLAAGSATVTNSLFSGTKTSVFVSGTSTALKPGIVVSTTVATFTGTGAETYSYMAVTAP